MTVAASWLDDKPELSSEPAIGYRVWRAGDAGLMSFVIPDPWQPGQKKVAACRIKEGVRPFLRDALPHRSGPPHRSPEPTCTCGIYSSHKLTDALKLIRSRTMCVGAVCCWGRVVVHDEGLRAQYAAVLGFCLPMTKSAASEYRVNIAAVAQGYHVPFFVDPDDLVAFATEFGVSYAPITD